MGILSLFRNLRRKADATRDPERRAADQETPRPAVPETSKSGSAPTFTALAERSVLVRPVVTEKATVLSGLGRYAFHVTPKATKTEIRRAVENLFSVHVTRVRLITLPSKLRRRGPIVGSVPGSRKALVTLRKSERIDLSAAMPFEHTPR